MKRFRKSICLILVVLMLAGMSSVFATNPDRYDYDCYGGYNTYMCIGDSIAAGYTVSGIYLDPVCLGFNRVTGAYHDLVATGINAERLQLGCSAVRTVELRYILDGVYTDTDGLWNEAFSQSFTIENLNALQPYFIRAVQAADIITVAEASSPDLRIFVVNPTKPIPPTNSPPSDLLDPTIDGVNRRRRWTAGTDLDRRYGSQLNLRLVKWVKGTSLQF